MADETIIEHIKKDHHKTEDQIAELEKRVKGKASSDDPVFAPMKKELLGHLAAEEKVLFPLLKNEIKEKIEDALKDHKEIRQYLEKLTAGEMPEEEWARTLKEMKQEIQDHTKEEEGEILPVAQKMLDQQRLKELGAEFEKVEKEYK